MSTPAIPNHRTHINVMENGRLVWKPKEWLDELKKQGQEDPIEQEPISPQAPVPEEIGGAEGEGSAEGDEQLPFPTDGIEQELIEKWKPEDEPAIEEPNGESVEF